MIFQKKQSSMLAVCDGVSAPIAEIPDEAFSLGLLGKGFAQDPRGSIFKSPVDGVVESVAKTKHAISIHTDNDLDVLIHIGVDTVEMNGEGFDVRVDAGDKVHAGQIVATADISLIKQRGFNPITAVLITNPEKIKNIAYKFGNTIAGKDTVMYYTRKG